MDWIIGDIHGEFPTLKRLVSRIRNIDSNPQLYCTGDITGRGCDSLSCAQWVLDEEIKIVLGNHDAQLLIIHYLETKPKDKDRLNTLVGHPIFTDYCKYLAKIPLVHDINQNTLLVHAGVNPRWSRSDVNEIQRNFAKLNGTEKALLIKESYEDSENPLANAVRYMMNVRFIHNKKLTADYREKGNWPTQSRLTPWYLPSRNIQSNIIFGHWAALGLYQNNGVLCLDGGVVWGNNLIAVGLDKDRGSTILVEPQVFS